MMENCALCTVFMLSSVLKLKNLLSAYYRNKKTTGETSFQRGRDGYAVRPSLGAERSRAARVESFSNHRFAAHPCGVVGDVCRHEKKQVGVRPGGPRFETAGSRAPHRQLRVRSPPWSEPFCAISAHSVFSLDILF